MDARRTGVNACGGILRSFRELLLNVKTMVKPTGTAELWTLTNLGSMTSMYSVDEALGPSRKRLVGRHRTF